MADPINTTLGHVSQVALIAGADVSALLTGARKTAWDANSDATAKDTAAVAASLIVNDMTWTGHRLFSYPQPFKLPTTSVCSYDAMTGASGSSTTKLVNTTLTTCNRLDWVGGSVHVTMVNDVDYGKAGRITAYARSTGTLTVTGDFAVSLENKTVIVVSPLPQDVRKALAIMAHELMLKKEHHTRADDAHKGMKSEWGEKGVAMDYVGPRALWHVEAYTLIVRFLAKSINIERS
jgi:hypothetical protein